MASSVERTVAAPSAGELRAAVEGAARGAGFTLDPSQSAVLDALVGAVCAAPHDAVGAYVWGPVGRGKTWLVDALCAALPPGAVSRFHFHRFFRELHEQVRRHGIGRPGIAAALDDLLGQAPVVVFDELFAHEHGDASLLTRLFEELARRDAPRLIVTSNYPPDGLLPDAVHETSDGPVQVAHRSFAEGIALIHQQLQVLHLDGGTDYRRQATSAGMPTPTGFRAGWYLCPGTGSQLADAGCPTPGRGPLPLESNPRLQARVVGQDTLWFEFDDLCSRPVGPADIVPLTSRYRRWIIARVPPMSRTTPEARQRFVNVVDVLHDADAALVVTSPVEREHLLDGRLPPDVARLESRLQLLRRPSGQAPSGPSTGNTTGPWP